jgi:hypothetical protein
MAVQLRIPLQRSPRHESQTGFATKRKESALANGEKLRGEVGEVGDGGLGEAGEVESGGVDVDVGVDEAGHEDFSGTIDDFRVGIGGTGGDFVDDSVFDEDVCALVPALSCLAGERLW